MLPALAVVGAAVTVNVLEVEFTPPLIFVNTARYSFPFILTVTPVNVSVPVVAPL